MRDLVLRKQSNNHKYCLVIGEEIRHSFSNRNIFLWSISGMENPLIIYCLALILWPESQDAVIQLRRLVI